MKNSITINGKCYSSSEILMLVENMPVEMPQHLTEVFQFLVNWYDENAYIEQQTSGSTGEPSVISLQKRHMWSSAKKTNTFFSLQLGDNVLLPLSTTTIAGKMMVVRAMVGGFNLLVIPTSGTPEIPDTRIAFAPFVPMQMEQLLNKNLRLENIQTVILGGAAVPASLKKRLQKVNCRVYATYGMTETCSHVAVQRLNGPNPDNSYRVLPGTTVTISSEGCIAINAPHILPSPITTTDLGEIPKQGRLNVLGRKDFIINSGGIKINPIPLEEQLQQKMNRKIVIVAMPDAKLGHRAVVVIEGEYNDRLAKKTSDFISSIRKETPISKEPVFARAFPKTSSLKTDRNRLLKQIIETY